MKTILPGAAIGLLGGGENSRMFCLAAFRMGYRVHVYSPGGDPVRPLADVSIEAPYGDLDRVREFAANVDVVTLASGDVPAISLQAASGSCLVLPGPRIFEAVENGIGTKRDASTVALVDFSVIAARGANGAYVHYPPIAIDRVEGVLDIARLPATIDSLVAKRAAGLTRDLLEELDFTGVGCVEFILTEEHQLVLHEVTPHPHPSGFLTLEACVTSQFDQHIRAICGLPLGSTTMVRPAAMAVLTPSDSQPDWAAACAFPEVRLHVYGSGGHLTATAASATLAKQIVRTARASLACN